MNSISFLLFFIANIFVKAQDPFGNDISGDNQIGEVNGRLKKQIVVRVLDLNQKAVANAKVVFAILHEPEENIVLQNFADLEFDTVLTNKDGYAMTNLRFGGARGNYYIQASYNNKILIFKAVALDRHWVIFLLFTLVGGLGLFLFGLNYGSKGLIREAGAKMRDLLFTLSRNRLSAVFVGIVMTIILGSSTATAVLLVRFASSGIVFLKQALGIILGADIGTTITVQLLAFNILDFGILIVGVGAFTMLFFPAFKNIGQVIFGIGLLFFALRIMSHAAVTLKYLPGFYSVVEYLGCYPVLTIIIGALVAFVLHSSAATIGVVLILAFQSLITTTTAIPLVMGANLGTTFSAFLVSNTVQGRELAFGHFLFKLLAVITIFPLLPFVSQILNYLASDTARQVANFHTIFNIFTALIFTPLITPFAAFLKSLVRESKKELLRLKRLDPAFLTTPAIALGEATRELLFIADITIKMMVDSIKVFENKDNLLRKRIIQIDDEVDTRAENITTYLTKLSQEEMDEGLSNLHKGLLGAVTELEHIGDIISKSLMIYAKKQFDSGFVFSAEGFSQLREFHDFVLTTLRTSANSLATHDKKLAAEAASRRVLGYNKAKEFERAHLARLAMGYKESLETSTIHLDIISDLERINFHASEIGKVFL